jgi:hypothetical protein
VRTTLVVQLNNPTHIIPNLGSFSIFGTLGTATRCGSTERWSGMIAIFFCSLDKTAAARLLEIPQWMFDATACYGMRLAPTPAICIETILDLERLLAQATSDRHGADIRLRHPAESAGGANAKRPAEWAISAISDTLAEDSSVGGCPYWADFTNSTSESEYPAGTGVVKAAKRGRTNEPSGYRRAADGVQGSGSCVRPTTLLVGDGSLWEAS